MLLGASLRETFFVKNAVDKDMTAISLSTTHINMNVLYWTSKCFLFFILMIGIFGIFTKTWPLLTLSNFRMQNQVFYYAYVIKTFDDNITFSDFINNIQLWPNKLILTTVMRSVDIVIKRKLPLGYCAYVIW